MLQGSGSQAYQKLPTTSAVEDNKSRFRASDLSAGEMLKILFRQGAIHGLSEDFVAHRDPRF